MKKHLSKIFALLFILASIPSFAQEEGGEQREGPSQVEIAATGAAEYLKKEIKLTKEQYPKVKKAYLYFMNYQAYHSGVPGGGTDKLYKSISKILTAEQMEKWKELEPNQPLTEEEKAALKKKKGNQKKEDSLE